MDLHYRPDASKHSTRDGCRPSEIARQRPALAPRIQGRESYQDFDAQHTLRGGHYTEEAEEPSMVRPSPVRRFVMNEEEACERMNLDLRGGHHLIVEGDSE